MNSPPPKSARQYPIFVVGPCEWLFWATVKNSAIESVHRSSGRSRFLVLSPEKIFWNDFPRRWNQKPETSSQKLSSSRFDAAERRQPSFLIIADVDMFGFEFGLLLGPFVSFTAFKVF